MENLRNEYASVLHNKTLGALQAEFFTYVPHNEFVDILKYEFEMIKHFNLKKCLIDLRKMKVYAPGNTEFIEKEWFPTVRQLGVEAVAFIVPEDVFAKVSMNASHKKAETEGSMKIRNFLKPEEAENWLKS